MFHYAAYAMPASFINILLPPLLCRHYAMPPMITLPYADIVIAAASPLICHCCWLLPELILSYYGAIIAIADITPSLSHDLIIIITFSLPPLNIAMPMTHTPHYALFITPVYYASLPLISHFRCIYIFAMPLRFQLMIYLRHVMDGHFYERCRHYDERCRWYYAIIAAIFRYLRFDYAIDIFIDAAIISLLRHIHYATTGW